LQGCADRREIKRLILTCSGGPFYGMTYDEVGKMTRADALKHPNWTMGPKITVDCATLMNKGLEVIEAMRLYRLPLSQVDVVIHRQSIVHSLVEFRDGAVLAQLGTPDMRLPIRYAMTYPNRGENPAEPLDLLSCPPLTFAAPDREAFPCLRLAEEAATEGGTACAILNGANEEAVRLFLADRIGFHDIPKLVAKARAEVSVTQAPSLEDILAADRAAREIVCKEQ
jgi:1-deoxy-D-xylulose-5-phosphate reductoisomerase